MGAALSDSVSLRARFRHANSHSGLPGEWNFNGYDPLVPANGPTEPLVPLQPDPSDSSQLNNLAGQRGVDGERSRVDGSIGLRRLIICTGTTSWIRMAMRRGLIRMAIRLILPRMRLITSIAGDLNIRGIIRRARGRTLRLGIAWKMKMGLWAMFMYGPQTHGQRLNNDVYVQQQVTLGRLSVIAGGRLVHDSAFGNTGLPRVALSFWRCAAGKFFRGRGCDFLMPRDSRNRGWRRRLRGRLIRRPNPGLKPERSRSFEAGLLQDFYRGKVSFNAGRTLTICFTIRSIT